MDDNGRLNMRVNHVEGQLSSTLRAVDELTTDVKELKSYAFENNKVVNSLINKWDDFIEEYSADRKLRAQEMQLMNRRLDLLEKQAFGAR